MQSLKNLQMPSKMTTAGTKSVNRQAFNVSTAGEAIRTPISTLKIALVWVYKTINSYLLVKKHMQNR